MKRIDVDKVSIWTAWSDVNISHKMYLDWMKQFLASKAAKNRNSKAERLCTGYASILKPVEAELTRFIFELREHGFCGS
jgi:hypothetical protein